MELSLTDVEAIFKKKMRTNQLILWSCVAVAVGVFLLNKTYAHWALIFAVFATINLPTINKCKQDLDDYKKNKLSLITGQVIDIFPKMEGSKEYLLFILPEGEKEPIDFELPELLDFKQNDALKIFYTNMIRVPIKIERLKTD